MTDFLIDPYKTAQIFLCHSCDDHRESHYLAEFLGNSFNVWYSCHGSMNVSDPIVPRTELVKSDLVLFLASKQSINPRSTAAAEYSIAQVLKIKQITGLAIIALGDFAVPPEHSDLLFERFRWQSRSSDVKRIVKSIYGRLSEDASFTTLYKRDFGDVVFGGRDVLQVSNWARKKGRKTNFVLNAPMQHLEMTRLIGAIDSFTKRDRNETIEFLKDIYFDSGAENLVARQNAIFILGKLAKGDQSITDELIKRYPDYIEPFLYRGFHIGMSYSHPDILDRYMQSLESEKTRIWILQRRINSQFHLLYYDGLPGVLHELRTSISAGRPKSLLRLNTYTLGSFSSEQTDVDLLSELRGYLELRGVPLKTIDNAIKRIRRKIIK